MDNQKVLQHMISWAIQTIYQTYKESMEIRNNKDLSEEDKLKQLHGSFAAPEYRLLNLVLLLKPAVAAVKEEFPDQEEFIIWLEDRLKYVEENKIIQKDCNCKGCKVEEPQLS